MQTTDRQTEPSRQDIDALAGSAMIAHRMMNAWIANEMIAPRRMPYIIASLYGPVGCCASNATLVKPPWVIVAITCSMSP